MLALQRIEIARFPDRHFWRSGYDKADYADGDDGRRLGGGAGGVPSCLLAPRRQGAGRPQVPGGTALLHGPQYHLACTARRVWPLEQRLEAVLAAEPRGCVRGLLPSAGRVEPDGSPGADVRQHRGASARLGCWCQRGQDGQALGRSRGGFSTKVHLKCDFDGQPLAFHLTGGEASDSRQFETLLDIGPDITPRAALTDKGYDGELNRSAARQRGICPVISRKSNAVNKPTFFPKLL